MGRILKALILGWIGKKIYDFTLGSDETKPKVAHSKAAPKRTAKRPTTNRKVA